MYETKIYSPAQIKEDAAVNDHAPNLQRLRYANLRYFISLNNIVTKTYGDATILQIIPSGNERAKRGYFVCNTNKCRVFIRHGRSENFLFTTQNSLANNW